MVRIFMLQVTDMNERRREMKLRFIFMAGVICLCLSGIHAYSAEEPGVDAKSLFEQKCSRCHTIERPKSKLKSRAEWEATVMRMKNVNGCPITDEEAKIIIQYLAENYGT